MKGRIPGRPTKWVAAKIEEEVAIGKPGVKFQVWHKWKWSDGDKKTGTLIVSVGGLRWRTGKGRFKKKSWDNVDQWFNPAS